MRTETSTGSGHGEQLQAITDAALAHLELDALLRTLVARICEILGIDSCTIAVHTAERDQIVSTGPQHDTLSTYVVPLELAGVLLGELRVAAILPYEFDTELLRLVADRAAMAIDHAQLFESERKARNRLECVQTVTDVALAHLELDELLLALLLRTRDILGVDTCATLLLDPARNELVARAAVGIEEEVEQGVRIPVGGGFAGSIAASRRPVILPDVDHAHVLNPILHEKGIKSLMGVPLIVHDDVIGVIHVGTLKPHEFTRDDVELLQLVGERAALAIEKARLHQEMVRLDQLKLNFVAIASHELRTPATSVYGLLTTLRARGNELAPDVRAELEETAWYQSDRLRRLIEQLLDLSRLDARAITVRPEPIVLERTLADLVTGDDVFIDVDPALAVVADPLVIERVVTNLIANARQHGRPPVHIHAEARDRHLRITVTDAGPGVPEQLVPRLFERFEHGGTSGGTGLGLAIAKAYANAHGGDLYYEPGPWGTRFDLVLPRV
jgi:signal transduction histidine kinase